jgi:hypothetical protein
MKYPIPRGSRRACLCRDGETYSIDCCEEDYFSQGIGSITLDPPDSAGTIVQTDTTESLGSTNTDPLPEAGLGVSDVTNEDTERSFTNSTDSTDDDDGGAGLPTTTTTTTLPVFDCTDAVFSIIDGTTGDSTSGQGSVTLGTISSITPSNYVSGSNTYTASINVPAGYSNAGQSIDCTDSANALDTFVCADAGFSMADGTVGDSTSSQGTVTLGTIESISPSTYSLGSQTYTATITVPAGYSNTGSTIDCTDTANALATFTCTDANFNMANGNYGDSTSGQGTVSLGTITSISPTQYSQGTNTYTASITVPSGYSNSGQTISCTDTAFGAQFGWFANSGSGAGFSLRADACSGSFADQTHVRVHFKNGSGVLQYPSTVQDVIDGDLFNNGDLLLYTDDGTGEATNTKWRGEAQFIGIVYKDVDDINVDTDPTVTLIALGSSTDSPPYIAEGTYSAAASCSP